MYSIFMLIMYGELVVQCFQEGVCLGMQFPLSQLSIGICLVWGKCSVVVTDEHCSGCS